MFGAEAEEITHAAGSSSPLELDLWIDQQDRLTHFEARVRATAQTVVKCDYSGWAPAAAITTPNPRKICYPT
ncbi:hypothetical protein SAMN04487818_113134 [Actinokineospora terrae]|uniref:Uncharacterized protein n=2 Tax=Actinokineospora terrae TaxID=155974 RepID=A0A1H9X8G5_9PSEU|nr:hypothetical protein SAMN04487818_113134 [Actinokineospora terrae]